jgi:ferric-dicitrate binding protein FerR (iron transport regulator)
MISLAEPSKRDRRRRGRNFALAAVLAAAAILFYVLTFVRMGGGG